MEKLDKKGKKKLKRIRITESSLQKYDTNIDGVLNNQILRCKFLTEFSESAKISHDPNIHDILLLFSNFIVKTTFFLFKVFSFTLIFQPILCFFNNNSSKLLAATQLLCVFWILYNIQLVGYFK